MVSEPGARVRHRMPVAGRLPGGAGCDRVDRLLVMRAMRVHATMDVAAAADLARSLSVVGCSADPGKFPSWHVARERNRVHLAYVSASVLLAMMICIRRVRMNSVLNRYERSARGVHARIILSISTRIVCCNDASQR